MSASVVAPLPAIAFVKVIFLALASCLARLRMRNSTSNSSWLRLLMSEMASIAVFSLGSDLMKGELSRDLVLALVTFSKCFGKALDFCAC